MFCYSIVCNIIYRTDLFSRIKILIHFYTHDKLLDENVYFLYFITAQVILKQFMSSELNGFLQILIFKNALFCFIHESTLIMKNCHLMKLILIMLVKFVLTHKIRFDIDFVVRMIIVCRKCFNWICMQVVSILAFH